MKQCTTEENNTVCVPEYWTCEGLIHCQENHTCVRSSVSSTNCAVGNLWCHFNASCILNENVCDGIPHCLGNEDELFCEGECVKTANLNLTGIYLDENTQKATQKS